MQVRFYALVMGKLVKPEDAVNGTQDGFDFTTVETILGGPLNPIIIIQPSSADGNNHPVNMIVAGNPRVCDATVMIWFNEECEPDYSTVLWVVNEYLKTLR